MRYILVEVWVIIREYLITWHRWHVSGKFLPESQSQDATPHITCSRNEFGIKIYTCNICCKVSSSKRNADVHYVLIHAEPTENPCEFCGLVFPDQYRLKRHIRDKKCSKRYAKDEFWSKTKFCIQRLKNKADTFLSPNLAKQLRYVLVLFWLNVFKPAFWFIVILRWLHVGVHISRGLSHN